MVDDLRAAAHGLYGRLGRSLDSLLRGGEDFDDLLAAVLQRPKIRRLMLIPLASDVVGILVPDLLDLRLPLRSSQVELGQMPTLKEAVEVGGKE